ncbi:TPA: WxL domain-containing protein [Enterococcus faecium]
MKSIRLLGAALLASTTLLGAGQAFAEVSQPSDPDPATAKTPINATLTLNEHPTAPEPPKGPDQGGTDDKQPIDSLFGIAYVPGVLSGNQELAPSGETRVSLTSSNSVNNPNNKHNVGVQDKTRGQDRNWTLKAQLQWEGANAKYMQGAAIAATGGKVQMNDGQGNLSDVLGAEVTTEESSLNIGKNETTIMTAHSGKTVNGVYNYQFQNPELVIPSSETVTGGQYTGNIVWNLSSVEE